MDDQNSSIPLLTVSGLIASLNQTLEYAYPSVEVEGEVMSFKVNQNKFVFFDLKDSGGSVNCFMTVWQLRTPIEDGMKVVVRATAKLTQWGKFSLTVQSIHPSGEGSLRKSYDLLKNKLEAEGLFAPERKRALPRIPRHIAVISSTQAAGYADFIKIINDRWGGVQIDVAHTQVQGEAAADQIVRAIRYFNEQPDLPEVLVIIRGGGSADDLSCFNDELLVREIAASRIPTIVGVGHEVDETLADFVADVRAATPSNAAQIVVPDRHEFMAEAAQVTARLIAATTSALAGLEQIVTTRIGDMAEYMQARVAGLETQLQNSQGLLAAYSPAAVLERGYAIVRGTIAVGATIEITSSDKEITAEVKHVNNRTNNN